MTGERLFASAVERNREPIRQVLGGLLKETSTVLEIASGTGEHGAFFTEGLTQLTWQPSDRTDESFGSVNAWANHFGNERVLAPIVIDVTHSPPWPVGKFDALFNANMIHISPWVVCQGLMAGAAEHLSPNGLLLLYGPFRVNNAHTAPSNAAFDQQLRQRDPQWGVRDIEAVAEQAQRCGLAGESTIAMPSNNQIVVFRKTELR